MNRKFTEEIIISLPIGSIFTLNGIAYKKEEKAYAKSKITRQMRGVIERIKFEELNIKDTSNQISSFDTKVNAIIIKSKLERQSLGDVVKY